MVLTKSFYGLLKFAINEFCCRLFSIAAPKQQDINTSYYFHKFF